MLFAKIITQEVIKGAGKFKDNFLKFLKILFRAAGKIYG